MSRSDETPFTTRFQASFGPNGAARITMFENTDAHETPILILDLDAADADLLARLLTTRRETYEQQRRDHQAGPQQ